MTRKETEHILFVLNKIKEPDGNVMRAIAYAEKQIKLYDACRGQLKATYEYDDYPSVF